MGSGGSYCFRISLLKLSSSQEHRAVLTYSWYLPESGGSKSHTSSSEQTHRLNSKSIEPIYTVSTTHALREFVANLFVFTCPKRRLVKRLLVQAGIPSSSARMWVSGGYVGLITSLCWRNARERVCAWVPSQASPVAC